MDKNTTENVPFSVVFLVGGVRLGLTKPEVADLQSAAIAAMRPSHMKLISCGAGDWTRTHNLLITNQLLCH